MSLSGKNIESATAWLKSAWRSSEGFLRNRSKVEMLTLEATNDVAWGPTGQQMADIAEASFDAESMKQVWGVLMQRFGSEPKHWRRAYKALLLTEHLVKHSSQHGVQVVLDGAGAINGLKHFKYLDEKNKDQGINVSNRAKELMLMLEDPDRIRAERTKAKALKGKFSGATKAQMALGAGPDVARPPSQTAGASTARALSSSSLSGSAAEPNVNSARPGRQTSGSSAGGVPTGWQALPAPARPDTVTGEERVGRGPAAQSSARGPPADPPTATAERVWSVRSAGPPCEPGSPAGSACSAPAAPALSPPPAAALPSSASHDDLSVARSGVSQTKPSLAELTARKGGPKRLQDVHINPAIRATLGSTPRPPPGPPHAAAHAANAPVSTKTATALPPQPLQGPAAAPAGLDSATHHLAAPLQSGSSLAAHAAPQHITACFADSAKPGGAPGGAISLTAEAGKPAAGSPGVLPKQLFGEAQPPPHDSGAAWGSFCASAEAGGTSLASGSPKALPPAAASGAAWVREDPFSEFDPFKGT